MSLVEKLCATLGTFKAEVSYFVPLSTNENYFLKKERNFIRMILSTFNIPLKIPLFSRVPNNGDGL